MRSYFMLLIALMFCFFENTSAQSNVDTDIDCKKHKKERLHNILREPLNFVWNDEYINATELLYQCSGSSLLSAKLMHDHYGIWDESFTPSASRVPFLVWKNRKLIENVPKTFTVITTGFKSKSTVYTIFIVIDENYKDMLAESSPYSEALEQIFTHSIVTEVNDYSSFLKDLYQSFPEKECHCK